ncbi:hypothetical protein OH492_21030 [Vibrio chagasii]|nr:hypothetical protein [Vibrio chagasii]
MRKSFRQASDRFDKNSFRKVEGLVLSLLRRRTQFKRDWGSIRCQRIRVSQH